MTGISGVNFIQPVSYQRPLRNVGVDSNASFQGNTDKTEKKNKHKLLKALVVVGIAIGGYILFKKHGKEIGSKTKELIDTLGQKTKDVINGFKGSKTAAEEAKAAAEAISKPFSTSAQTINKNLGIKDAVKSAADSAAVFEAHGLTEIESKLNMAETAAKIAKPRPTITFTEADVVAPVVKPTVKPEVKPSASNDFLGDAVVAPVSKPQAKPRPTITFTEADVVAPAAKPQVKPRPTITFTEADVVAPAAKPRPTISFVEEEAVQVAKPQAKPRPTISFVEDEAVQVAKPQVKKSSKSFEEIIPSKREIIREQTSLNPGQRVKPKGKAHSKKVRHNERHIIEQLMN